MDIVGHVDSQREEIQHRLKSAVMAGGDRGEIEHLFSQLELAWTGILMANPGMLQLLGIGFIRGFHPGDPTYNVRQAKFLLTIAAKSAIISELVNLLGDYFQRFLVLREHQPEVANRFARAVFLLSPHTVTMDIE